MSELLLVVSARLLDRFQGTTLRQLFSKCCSDCKGLKFKCRTYAYGFALLISNQKSINHIRRYGDLLIALVKYLCSSFFTLTSPVHIPFLPSGVEREDLDWEFLAVKCEMQALFLLRPSRKWKLHIGSSSMVASSQQSKLMYPLPNKVDHPDWLIMSYCS